MLKFHLTGRIYGILSKLDPVLDPAKTRPYEKTGSCGKTRPQEKSLFKKLKYANKYIYLDNTSMCFLRKYCCSIENACINTTYIFIEVITSKKQSKF